MRRSRALRLRLARLARLVPWLQWGGLGRSGAGLVKKHSCDDQVRLMRFRMFRELKLMVLGLFSGLRALCASALCDLCNRLCRVLLLLPC